jgi:hypothetical protein
MTFSDRIETLVGSYPYGTRLEQILDEAARLLIAELPEAMLMSFASEETDNGTTGVNVTNKRIVKAHKNGYPARLIDETLRTRLTNTAEPTPVYYVLNNTAYVKPKGGTITTISFPNIKRSDTTVSGWPTMLVDLLVERAGLLILDLLMVDVREGYGTSVTLPTVPTAPAAPSFSTTDAVAVAPSATSVSSLPTAPVYIEPVIDAEVAPPSVADFDGLDALTAPTAPSAPSLDYVNAEFASVVATSIDSLGSAPTYVKSSNSLDLTEYNTYEGDEDSEMMGAILSRLGTQLAERETNIKEEINDFQRQVAEYQQDANHKIEQARIALQEAVANAQASTDVNVRNQAARLEADVQEYNLKLSLFERELALYQAKVDVEIQKYVVALDRLIQLYGTQNSIKIERFGAALQNARSKFEKELAVYNAGVQLNNLQAEITSREAAQTASQSTEVAVQNKARQLEKEVQEYQSNLARYQSQLQAYSEQVQAALSNQGVVTESVGAKIRMIAFDKDRHESRYSQRFRAFMRAFYPRKSYTIKQHAI